MSIFLTCIHRVRSDHSHKSQVLASLPSSAPDVTQRAGRPVSFAKPVHCDSQSSPARRRPNLAARLARAPSYVHTTPASCYCVSHHALGFIINTADLPTQIIADINSSTHQLIADDAPMRLAHGARSCVQPPPAVCPWSHLDARARGSAGDDHVSQTQTQTQAQCFQPSVL